MAEVRAGDPAVVAGHAGLQAKVRWVHVSEVPDIAQLLNGGELILTTGIALPEAPGELQQYVRDLAEAKAAGVVIELVRRFSNVPVEMIRAADGCSLPLVVLHQEVRFVTITEAVHSRIVNARVSDLAAEDAVHRALQAMTLESASVTEITERMAELAHCPVVVENLGHQPVAFATAGRPAETVLSGWSARSRRQGAAGQGWACAPIGARGQIWGRVVLLPDHDLTARQRAVLEDGATSLAVARLLERRAVPLEQAARRALLAELCEGRLRSFEELHVRAEALGACTRNRRLRPVAVVAAHAAEGDVLAALASAGVAGLAGTLKRDTVGVLVSGRAEEPTDRLVEALAAAALRGRPGPGSRAAPGVGAALEDAGDLEGLARGFSEAEEAARAGAPPAGRHFCTIADIHLPGLLRLLADDPRLQRFVERELGVLWDHDEHYGSRLYDLVATYVHAGGNKSMAAVRFHLSRAAFYQHLQRAAELLGRDLEDPEVRTALHVAVLAAEGGGLGPGSSDDHNPGGRRHETRSAP